MDAGAIILNECYRLLTTIDFRFACHQPGVGKRLARSKELYARIRCDPRRASRAAILNGLRFMLVYDLGT